MTIASEPFQKADNNAETTTIDEFRVCNVKDDPVRPTFHNGQHLGLELFRNTRIEATFEQFDDDCASVARVL